jgi:hypothetical protein
MRRARQSFRPALRPPATPCYRRTRSPIPFSDDLGDEILAERFRRADACDERPQLSWGDRSEADEPLHAAGVAEISLADAALRREIVLEPLPGNLGEQALDCRGLGVDDPLQMGVKQ